MKILKTVVEVAKSYVGQQEIKGNQGFKDKDFQKRMEEVGFVKGYAWCCLFAELCWRSAMIDKSEELNKLFSASVSRTQNNLIAAEGYSISKKPTPGALAIFRVVKRGKLDWRGHIGIVEKVDAKNKQFTCVEGNTNGSGGREGIEVAIRKRKIEFDGYSGLVLQGFITPDNND